MAKIASVLLRQIPARRYTAVCEGLRAIGYSIRHKALDRPEPDDVLVIWNRYANWERFAKAYERYGAKVLIIENGYIGNTKAIALNHHSGIGSWHVGEEDRWAALDIELAPWRTDGDHIVVLPQRGIGEPNVAMPRNWLQSTLEQLKKKTNRPILINKHPGTGPDTLYKTLKGAWAAVTWGSGAGVKSICAGIPVFHSLSGWIGADAAREGMDIENPFIGDRMPMLHKLAWAQWTVEEIQRGEPFKWLL